MSRTFRVLYVDDEEINLFLFERTFERHFNIVTATSGAEGLKKLESYTNEIIVVIADMRMPIMTGIEFIHKAKKRFNDVAYYVLSAFDFSPEINTALNDKLIEKSFTKPFDVNMIKAEVESVIQRFE